MNLEGGLQPRVKSWVKSGISRARLAKRFEMVAVDDIESQPLLLSNRADVASTSSSAPHEPQKLPSPSAHLHAAQPDLERPYTSSQTAPRVCRFCFGEEGDAEDAALGKMITPCLCRDVVHIQCLKTWRESSSQAFHTCNVCKFKYKFQRLPSSQIVWLKLTIPLYPLALFAILVLLLGFWPIIAPAEGNFYIHLFNGFCALGLVYLIIMSIGINIHYCFMAIASAQAMNGGALTREIKFQLAVLLIVRCFIVFCLFAFLIAFLWPLSSFVGAVFLMLITPTAVKEFSDKLIRRLETNRPVLEINAQMAAEAAAEMAQAAAAEAARQREREMLLARDVEEGLPFSFPQENHTAPTRGEYIELTTFEPSPPPPLQASAAPSVNTLPGQHHSTMMMTHGANIEQAIAIMRQEHGSTVFLGLPLPPSRPSSPPPQQAAAVSLGHDTTVSSSCEPQAQSIEAEKVSADSMNQHPEAQVKHPNEIEKKNPEDPREERK